MIGDVLVEAVYPQPVPVDTRRLSTGLAAPHDDTLTLQVLYPCKVFITVDKCADGARRHHYLAELGWHTKSSLLR